MPTELRKALTSSGDGAALNLDDIDMVLHEELLKLQPLAQIMETIQSEGKTHDYRVRSSHPQAWFEGEVTQGTVQNGAYQRKTVSLKIQRIWGSVTRFSRAVTERFIDNLEEELRGAVEGMANTFEYGALYGIADDIGFTGDAYQYSGVLPRLYAYAPGNVIDAGGDKIGLADLDAAIAKVANYRQTRMDPKLWVMGLQMKQVVDGLQTKVQLPLQNAVLAEGKIEMSAYGGNPIYESDFTVPGTTSPALTSALASGGSLVDSTAYQHQIASVTIYGECVASALSTARTAGSGNNTVNLSWTADSNAKSYMIFRKTASGDPQLIDIIPAKTYDANGLVNGSVAAYADNGSKTPIAVKPLATGEQQIVLMDVNPARGAAFVGKVDDYGDRTDGLITFEELAKTKDTFDFMLKSYLALRLVYPNLVSVIRHCKLA